MAIGTLYRHFPTRDELLLAVFAGKLDVVARTGEQSLADPDPLGQLTGPRKPCARWPPRIWASTS